MKLFLIHVGFYDPDIMDGLYEQHSNYFVVAEDIKDAKQSLIIEYIANILREPKIDFTGDYPERKLTIVSDLMQMSDRINFYKFCKSVTSLKKPDKCQSFQKLLKKPGVKHYLDTI